MCASVYTYNIMLIHNIIMLISQYYNIIYLCVCVSLQHRYCQGYTHGHGHVANNNAVAQGVKI